MKAEDILFRSSKAGALMTAPRNKSEKIGETTKGYLTDVFINEVYGREKDISNKYFDKGLSCEENSLTLFSRIEKQFFKKNERNFKNDFITGTPDIIQGDTVIDIKTSFDLFTFYESKKELNKNYYWQLVSYMWLTGCKKAVLVHCLVNSPEHIINDEKRKLTYQIKAIDPESSPEYFEKCKQIEINHIFDLDGFRKEYPFYDFANDLNEWNYDIPIEKRINKFTFDRDESEIELLQQKIKDCREWMDKNLFNS